jgi:hypothetical protein
MGDTLDEMFAHQMGETYVTHSKPVKLIQQRQVREMVTMYKKDMLLSFRHGREHKSFRNFFLNANIKHPGTMKERLYKHCIHIDYISDHASTEKIERTFVISD